MTNVPSAANGKGFKPLGDYVHKKGLKFGIHIMRGIARQAVDANTPIKGVTVHAADIAAKYSICPWNPDMYGVDMTKPGAQAYYDSLFAMYASWGVDFVKVDDISRACVQAEIEAIPRNRQDRTAHRAEPFARPHLYSRRQFSRPQCRDVAHLERFRDRWQDLKRQFELLKTWGPYTKPGSWPDADMLPLGRIAIRGERGDDRMTQFTRDEQQTLMSLWAIARSPLMYGGDLPSNDAFSLSLLTNEEVLSANQHGENSHQLFREGDQIAWASDVPHSNSKYLALFNVGDHSPQDIHVDFARLGLPAVCQVRDLWQKITLGKPSHSHTFRLAPHASGLYKITPSQ